MTIVEYIQQTTGMNVKDKYNIFMDKFYDEPVADYVRIGFYLKGNELHVSLFDADTAAEIENADEILQGILRFKYFAEKVR